MEALKKMSAINEVEILNMTEALNLEQAYDQINEVINKLIQIQQQQMLQDWERHHSLDHMHFKQNIKYLRAQKELAMKVLKGAKENKTFKINLTISL